MQFSTLALSMSENTSFIVAGGVCPLLRKIFSNICALCPLGTDSTSCSTSKFQERL